MTGTNSKGNLGQEVVKLKPYLAQFDKSPAKLLSFAYPHHEWFGWKFEIVPKDSGNQTLIWIQ